jgi:hypothetical protein
VVDESTKERRKVKRKGGKSKGKKESGIEYVYS